jgi:hypothetical protein
MCGTLEVLGATLACLDIGRETATLTASPAVGVCRMLVSLPGGLIWIGDGSATTAPEGIPSGEPQA